MFRGCGSFVSLGTSFGDLSQTCDPLHLNSIDRFKGSEDPMKRSKWSLSPFVNSPSFNSSIFYKREN